MRVSVFKIFKYVFLAVLLVLIVAAGILLTLDVNQYKGDLVEIVKENTGRDFKIKGDLKLALSLIPTIAVDGVSFGNAAWGSRPDMVKVGRFEARVAVMPLFSGNIKVTRLILHDSEIFLETGKNGVGNWVLRTRGAEVKPKGAKAGKDKAASAKLPVFDIGKIEIKNAKLTYKNGRTGKTYTVAVPTLTSEPADGGAFMHVKLDVVYDEFPVKVDGKFGLLQQLIEDKPYPVNAAVVAGKTTLQVQGKIEHPAGLKGISLAVNFKARDLKDFGRFIKGELPGITPLSLTGVLTDEKGVYNLKSLNAGIGNSDLSGEASVALGGKRPFIRARLDSKRIDITPLQKEKAQKKRKKVFPATKLPTGFLLVADTDIKAQAGEVLLKGMALKDVSLSLKLADGHMTLSPLEAGVAGGRLAADLELSAVKGVVQINADVKIKQLVPSRLPKFRDRKIIEDGKTDIFIKGAGEGRSAADILAGFNGQLLVQIGKGKLQNSMVNFAGADLLMTTLSKLNPLSGQEKVTELQCGVINFSIENGMARTDKGIAFETDKMAAVGSGTINLKTEELDLGVRPYPRKGIGINAGKFTQMARLGGTLAEPKTKFDTVAALKTAASTGAAVATLGLSLLAEGIFARTTADDHPCETALGKTSAKSSATTPATKTEEKPQSAGDKVKGFFNGLFGK